MKWPQRPLGDSMPRNTASVNPLKFPSEEFELYSIPAYENQRPEVLRGAEIGSSKQVIQAGDVLFSRIVPHIRRAWVVGAVNGRRAIGSGEWIIFRDSRLDANYLRHYLLTDAFHTRVMKTVSGVGGSLLRARPSEVAKVGIPVPPLAEQKRIAAILDKADAIRRKRQQALQLTDEFLRSLFLDMFGDPATNPMKFPIVRIGDIVSSANYGTSEKSLETGKYPVLRMLNITYEGGWNCSNLKFTDLDGSQAERYLVRKGDILFNRTNSRDLVGKTAVFRSDTPMAYAGYLIRLRANERAHPEYIAAFLNTGYMKRILRDKCKDIIGMANINARELQAFHIPLPPFSTQAAFAAVVEEVISGRSLFERASRDAEILSRALSNRAFAAELTISHV